MSNQRNWTFWCHFCKLALISESIVIAITKSTDGKAPFIRLVMDATKLGGEMSERELFSPLLSWQKTTQMASVGTPFTTLLMVGTHAEDTDFCLCRHRHKFVYEMFVYIYSFNN